MRIEPYTLTMSTPMPPVVRLDAVSKRYQEQRVVDSVDLVVPAGDTVILIGPSGCGKSTLLRLMLGLIRPDGGRVIFEGEPLGPDSVRRIRRRVGYVIQDGGLFPHMTARQNITLPVRQQRWDAQRVAARLDELVGLTSFPADGLDRYPVELSGGQRQRVALMRALMSDPDLLLLDEPLGALDPMVRHDLQSDLREIFLALGKTTVLVTHDLSEAIYFGRRMVLMRDGRIIQDGSPEDLMTRPADPFVTRFFAAQRDLRPVMGGSPVA